MANIVEANRIRASLWHRLLGVGAVVTALVGIYLAVFDPPFHSTGHVTDRMKAAIMATFIHHEFSPPYVSRAPARLGCPVDVLGSTQARDEVIVYAVVHCWSSGPACKESDYDGTSGIVARLRGDVVVSASYDDAIDYEGGMEEAKIYPKALRTKAFNLMDDDGPAGYDRLAHKIAGCP
jgi:hypothetical protein